MRVDVAGGAGDGGVIIFPRFFVVHFVTPKFLFSYFHTILPSPYLPSLPPSLIPSYPLPLPLLFSQVWDNKSFSNTPVASARFPVGDLQLAKKVSTHARASILTNFTKEPLSSLTVLVTVPLFYPNEFLS